MLRQRHWQPSLITGDDIPSIVGSQSRWRSLGPPDPDLDEQVSSDQGAFVCGSG